MHHTWSCQHDVNKSLVKGVIGCKIHFSSCLNINVCWKCVHIHPIMIKIHPEFFFFIPILKSPFSNQAVLRFLSEWRSSVQAAPTIVDLQDCLTLDLPWVNRVVLHCVDSGAVEDKMSPIKRFRCFVVGYNNEYSSRQLLRTSELLKMQRINVAFALKGMRRSRSA